MLLVSGLELDVQLFIHGANRQFAVLRWFFDFADFAAVRLPASGVGLS